MCMRNSVLYAFRRSIPIMVGFFPVGVAYGILMAELGYNFLWSAISSVFIYAGSLQMLMVSFLMNNVPLFTVTVMALLLNSRHIFYGISFIDKFKPYGWWKYLLIYGMSDESYSLLCSYKDKDGVNEKWVHIFTTVLIWFYWVLFSGLGGLIGAWIPFDTTGIDFALTALFVVIFLEKMKQSSSKLPGLLAVISSLLWMIVVGTEQFLLPSLMTTVAVLILLKNNIPTDKEVR